MIRVNDGIEPNILIIKSTKDTFDYSHLSTWEEDCIPLNRKYHYQIQYCESTLEVLEICQHQLPDCILLDWESAELISEPNVVEREELIQRLHKDFVPVISLVEAKNENVAIAQNHPINYLIKEALTKEFLNFAVSQAISQTKLNQKLAEAEIKAEKYEVIEAKNKILTQRLQLEQAVNLLLQSIHSSFDLSTVFTAATTGVGKLLKIDRVQISQYLPDREIWKPLIEYCDSPTIPSVLGLEIPDRDNLISLRLKQGEVVCINCSAEIDCSVNQDLVLEYPGSWLIAPLIVGMDIWGSISLASHDRERRWQDIEIDLVGNVSTQIAIAIQQSQSHHNLSLELQHRAQAEVVLQERGSLLKAIFECSAVGIVITDATGKFVQTNPCYQEMVGYSEIELESINFTAFTYPEDLPENYKRFMAVVRGEQNSFSIEKRYRHRNGSYLWVRVNCFKIDVPAGKPQLFIALIENISDRKSTEIDLEQLNQQLEFKVKQRTSALQASESRFKSFFDFAPFGIAVADVQTYQFVAVNNAFCQLLEYTEAELLESGSCPTVSDVSDWELERPYIQSMMRGEVNSYQIEKHYIKKNGELILGELTTTLIKDEAGNIIHLVGMVRDISDRKRIEMALQASESNNRAILEAIPDLLLRLKRDGTCLNYIKSRIGEENFIPIEHHISEVLSPDLLQKQLKAMEQTIATGELQIYEHQFHKHDRIIHEEVRMLAINDNEILAIVRDISDRKNAENKLRQSQESLRQSEELLRLTIENTPVGICTFNLEGNLLSVNHDICKMFGYSRDEMLLKNVLQLTHPDYRKLSLDSIHKLISGQEKNVLIEKQYIHKNGIVIDAISRVSLIEDINGNPLHFVASVQDITDQKRTAIALNQQMDRQQFLMNITQQIRQSLNLDRVLTTAVDEVKRLLNCDRAIVFQLFNDGVTRVVKEAVEPGYPAIIDRNWLDEHFTNVGFDYYINTNIRIVNDVAQDTWASCLSEFMQEAQIKSKIVAPIVKHIKPIKDFNPNPTSPWQKGESQLWGLLIAHSCGELRQWHSEEAELLQQIANQLAIAIQQADLYQQVQNELAARQQFEQELQTQAAADRLLSEVNVAINQSINVDEALDLILKKVQEFLKCDRVQIFQLDNNFDGFVIKEEVSRPELAILGARITDACFATTNLVEEYLQGKLTILPDVLNAPNLTPCYVDLLKKYQIRANLAAPIIHSYQLWGLLIVHQCDSPRVWLASEVNLVKQVAAQVGISAQKEKLYSRLINELTQKKVLLKEIHHRVKNNLQVMSSLLRMQFRKTSPEVKILAEEYQNRIQSMALIHDQLYRSDDLSHIDFHRYISNLACSLFQCYGTNSALVNLSLQVDNILMPLDQSIPLGLIINELVSNALKYAFPQGYGKIDVQLIEVERQYVLIVSDNGIGIPANFDLQNTDSLGMQLVQSLTHQLEGEFTYNGKNGSTFQIAFPSL
jgi:PAS domain S-box-containing protein